MKYNMKVNISILFFLIFLFSCDKKTDNNNIPTFQCFGSIVDGNMKIWADSTCSCGSHTGPFGCVLTLTCPDGIKNQNVTDVFYGDKSKWLAIINLLTNHVDKDVRLVGSQAEQVLEMINQNGQHNNSDNINKKIMFINNTLESLPLSVKENLLLEFNKLIINF